MTSIPSFSFKVFCLMITTSPPSGSTTNGILNRTGPHGVSMVRWSGHDCVTLSHSWTKDVTTRAFPTNASVNVVCIIPGCHRWACASSSDIVVIPEPESLRTFASATADALGTARPPTTCCGSTSKYGSACIVPTLAWPDPPGYKTETRECEMVLDPLLRRGRRQLHWNRLKDWCAILRPCALRNMVLHRLGAPGIHWRHLLPRHANVHVVVILLRRRRRRSRFDSRNHRF